LSDGVWVIGGGVIGSLFAAHLSRVAEVTLLCRRADFTAKIWPGNRQELYESGLTVDEAMLKTYPEWKPWGDSAERETP